MLKSVPNQKFCAHLLSGLSCGQSRSPARTVFIRDVVVHLKTTMKNSVILLNSILVLIVFLFLLDVLSSFEIKSQAVKSFTYFGVIILTPLTLIWNIMSSKGRRRKFIAAAFPFLVLTGILIVGPMKIVFSSSAWKTQKIVYQNQKITFKKVEFQMQDAGALGYNRRTVEVTYLTDFFMIVEPTENGIAKEGEWVKVDKEINELGLKTP